VADSLSEFALAPNEAQRCGYEGAGAGFIYAEIHLYCMQHPLLAGCWRACRRSQNNLWLRRRWK
jgi:hypothetical protein